MYVPRVVGHAKVYRIKADVSVAQRSTLVAQATGEKDVPHRSCGGDIAASLVLAPSILILLYISSPQYRCIASCLTNIAFGSLGVLALMNMSIPFHGFASFCAMLEIASSSSEISSELQTLQIPACGPTMVPRNQCPTWNISSLGMI